ncbi:hypothetical protein AS156_32100 [Bradyrhizobium macuxiense]|uniref:Uncharacterized protein n=1 Tax=Bradyrhizobium macuxiense TaxID=1755647 RepID=A0A109K1Y0_9BRAD|nr:hypothetical protein [Bradyrhizobium macuxiense]KWV59307.1 hypothetical protein AS156_32100 [Bradyrhizobium macuxiense]
MRKQPGHAAATTGGRSLSGIGVVAAITFSVAANAAAKPPGQEAWLIRMLVCQGSGVQMEVYLPQPVVFAPHGMAAGQTVNGYYTLDLSPLNKGKGLEPVHVTMSADKRFVTVDQYTRGLPPTRIPIGGGTVDFDQRFAVDAKCGPFQAQDPNYGN